MLARLSFVLSVLFAAACSGGLDLTPEPFTRERADGKIPVKTALIREQVLAQLAGMPEGEAKVTRWQHIETDYHACRLLSGKAETASEQVFADCMANRGYVYMYRIDAEHLHNDIEFEVEKEYDKYPDTAQKAAAALLAAQTKREEEQQEFARREELPDNGSYANYLYALAGIGGVAALAAGGGGDTAAAPTPNTTIRINATIGIVNGMTITIIPTMSVQIRPCLAIVDGVTVTICQPISLSISVDGILTTTLTTEAITTTITMIVPGAMPITTIRTYTMTAMTFTMRATTFATASITLDIPDISHTPQMSRVVHAAMADGFNSGVAIGESGFAFSGRYDGDNRAAGFTYHLGDYLLRTDYIRLPSRQDGEVWLDTFRFGALSRVNDEVRLFAGMDNYRNAIFAIDTNGDSQHRFGVAIGERYAARYEYRIRL